MNIVHTPTPRREHDVLSIQGGGDLAQTEQTARSMGAQTGQTGPSSTLDIPSQAVVHRSGMLNPRQVETTHVGS